MQKKASTYTLLTTGVSKTTKAYNLYDVAGNVWEWTDETSFYGENTSSQYKINRGDGFHGDTPVCFRYGLHNVKYTDTVIGFRVVLCIK